MMWKMVMYHTTFYISARALAHGFKVKVALKFAFIVGSILPFTYEKS